MIPTWIKHFLKNQRTKKLRQRQYIRSSIKDNICYGKVYGYEYISSTNESKKSSINWNALSKAIQHDKRTTQHYQTDNYDRRYNSRTGVAAACGADIWYEGDTYGDGVGDCNDGGCDSGGGDDGGGGGGDGGGDGGGCGGGCGGCGGD
ncbi:unnamed protein product [Adineta steineri]|uniref:Uncharacterized protein n=1 Tax=Adineta steineri TaxID=433720 RepID=A0A814UJ05_9BILA|nr:unnamed protein product [Adineta steineri]CAF1175324.1 unnamed protein product [Adineta steineri]CAF1229647.1 unnamed protein product [Adineta steineri]CAF3772908.1 unnamed protein product [Adineta steineri]CAF3820493.1 unnamed protein product [Adineta steineri]